MLMATEVSEMKPHNIKQGTIVTCPKTNQPLMRYLVTVGCRHRIRPEMVDILVKRLRVPVRREPRQTDFIYKGSIFMVVEGRGVVTQVHTEDGWIGGEPPKQNNNERTDDEITSHITGPTPS